MVNEGFTADALRPYRPAIMSMILPPAPGMSAFCASSLDLLLLPPDWREVRPLLEAHGAGVSFGLGRQIRIAWRGRRASLQIRADGAMAEAETNALLGLIKGDSDTPARIALHCAYPASVTFDPQLELFVARALAIPDLVMAAGRNRTQMACAFEIAVMDYQSFCKARGEEPALHSAAELDASGSQAASSSQALLGSQAVLPLLTT